MRFSKIVIFVLLGTILVGGCQIKDRAVIEETSNGCGYGYVDCKAVRPPNVEPVERQPIKSTILKPMISIYFRFDKYEIEKEYEKVISDNGRYLLVEKKDIKIAIQGNADERGSDEYNLALGQKRAEAVRKALSVLGVQESRMEAISFGKEKPRALGHDEVSWAENRRVDIVY